MTTKAGVENFSDTVTVIDSHGDAVVFRLDGRDQICVQVRNEGNSEYHSPWVRIATEDLRVVLERYREVMG